MADDEAMSMGMATLELANAGADVAAEPNISEVPPVNTQPAENSIGVGDFILAPSVALVASVSPTARQAIQSAGVRIAVSAERNHPVIPDCDVTMHEGSFPRLVRHEFNRQWLATGNAYSKDMKFDGLSIVPQSQDQKSRFQLFIMSVPILVSARVLAMTRSPLTN
jgi:hypothetical protein